MPKTVKIGRRIVPLVKGKSIGIFEGGRKGIQEKGTYCFWTAVCLSKDKTRGITGRAASNLDAGERFRRMEKESKTAATASDRKAYKKLWKILQLVLYVRPANVSEVINWLNGHTEDAEYLRRLKL